MGWCGAQDDCVLTAGPEAGLALRLSSTLRPSSMLRPPCASLVTCRVRSGPSGGPMQSQSGHICPLPHAHILERPCEEAGAPLAVVSLLLFFLLLLPAGVLRSLSSTCHQHLHQHLRGTPLKENFKRT